MQDKIGVAIAIANPKEALRAGWGAWAEVAQRLGRSPLGQLAAYLAEHPGDFRGALAAQRSDLRSLWLAAYQSHLWNRLLAAVLQGLLPAEARVDLPLREGPATFWLRLSDAERAQLRALTLPAGK